jgi:hypothetical protein
LVFQRRDEDDPMRYVVGFALPRRKLQTIADLCAARQIECKL